MAAANRDDAYSKLAEEFLGVTLHDPEPTIDDILDAFDDFSVSKSAIDVSQRSVASLQNLHEVHFEVPAVSLLPRDATPILPPPYQVTRRECPRPSYNLDTSFNIRFQADCVYVSYSEVPQMIIEGNGAESLHKHMVRVQGAPGISTLGFVAYLDEDDFVQYRARLETTWHTASGKSAETKLFDIDGEDWMQLLDSDTTADWAQMVNHIMQRCSDRAFFHVHERLQAFDLQLAIDEVEMWAKHWGTATMHTAKDFLKQNIVWDGGSTSWEGKMPCGHMQAITPIALVEEWTDEEAEEFACDACHAYALTEDEYEQVRMTHDRINRVKARYDEQCWKQTKRQALVAGPQTFQATHREVRDAIVGSAFSFIEPESVVPYSMSPVYYHETLVVVQHVNAVFENADYKTTIDTDAAPEAFLAEFLEVLAADAGVDASDDIDQVLPMGYHTFLFEWIARAFVYLRAKHANRANDLADELMNMMMSGSKNKSPRMNANEEAGPKCFAFDN